MKLAAVMLSQLLEHEGYKAESLSYKTLANEMGRAGVRGGCDDGLHFGNAAP